MSWQAFVNHKGQPFIVRAEPSPTDPAGIIRVLQGKLVDTAESAERERRQIFGRPDLSNSGKQDAVGDVGARALARVKNLFELPEFLGRFQQALAKLRAALHDGLPDEADVAFTQREIEARDRLREQSPSQRVVILDKAISNADKPTVAAILRSFEWDPLLSPEIIRSARDRWLAASNGDRYRTLKATEGAEVALRHTVSEFLSGLISEFAPLPEEASADVIKIRLAVGLESSAKTETAHEPIEARQVFGMIGA